MVVRINSSKKKKKMILMAISFLTIEVNLKIISVEVAMQKTIRILKMKEIQLVKKSLLSKREVGLKNIITKLWMKYTIRIQTMRIVLSSVM